MRGAAVLVIVLGAILYISITRISANDVGIEAILKSVKPGHWLEIPGTQISKVFPEREAHPAWGVIGPKAVIIAWSGATYDSKRKVLVVTGGGHGDYGGNEVYEFHLKELRWQRATEPSPMRLVGKNYEVIGSQAPVSTHTYDGLVYLPTLDRVFKFGGSCYLSGAACDAHAYLYDVEGNEWRRASAAQYKVLEVAADYDAVTQSVFVSATAGLLSYDPSEDLWRTLWYKDPSRAPGVATIDPERRILVQTFSSEAELAYYELDRPGARQAVQASGDLDFDPHGGLAYHPPSKRMVIWSGGGEVWTFNTRDWIVTKHLPAAQPTPKALDAKGLTKTRGVYGRWQWLPEYDVFLAYNHHNENVWLYRLPQSTPTR